MPVPKLSADVTTLAQALRLAEQYKRWSRGDDVPHPGHETMCHVALFLAERMRKN